MAVPRWAQFCAFILLGLGFSACSDSVEEVSTELAIGDAAGDVDQSSDTSADPPEGEDRPELKWKGFHLRPIEPPATLGEWENASTALAYELVEHNSMMGFQAFLRWLYPKFDPFTQTIIIRTSTRHGPIWIMVPQVLLPLGSNSHLIRGVPGQDPLEFTLETIRQHEPSDLVTFESAMASSHWQPLQLGLLAHPQIGMAFILPEGATVEHILYYCEFAARAGAPCVSFHQYWVDEEPPPEED